VTGAEVFWSAVTLTEAGARASVLTGAGGSVAVTGVEGLGFVVTLTGPAKRAPVLTSAGGPTVGWARPVADRGKTPVTVRKGRMGTGCREAPGSAARASDTGESDGVRGTGGEEWEPAIRRGGVTGVAELGVVPATTVTREA
jgi:hypothetical protein